MLPKQKILVVDDDCQMNHLLRDFLTRQGYSVTTANSASNALRMIQALATNNAPAPDLVISDVIMGSMSGLDLTKQLKSSLPKLPVVLMSSFGNGDIEREAFASGAKAYLPKPFQLSQMAKVVQEQLQKK